MDHFAGLDVSVNETSVRIVDETGRIIREAKPASEPILRVGDRRCRSLDMRPEATPLNPLTPAAGHCRPSRQAATRLCDVAIAGLGK